MDKKRDSGMLDRTRQQAAWDKDCSIASQVSMQQAAEVMTSSSSSGRADLRVQKTSCSTRHQSLDTPPHTLLLK